MKKTYLKPTMKVVPVRMQKMLCASIESNMGLRNGGETPSDFDEDDIR